MFFWHIIIDCLYLFLFQFLNSVAINTCLSIFWPFDIIEKRIVKYATFDKKLKNRSILTRYTCPIFDLFHNNVISSKGRLTSLYCNKVEKILKGSLDSIQSPTPSVKIRVMGGEVFLRCKVKTLLGIVKKLLSNVLPYYLK